jgi:phosphomannomutase
VNLLDGVKIDEEDYWVHLRKSNTEPIIRIIAEAKTAKEAQSIVEEYSKLITKLS